MRSIICLVTEYCGAIFLLIKCAWGTLNAIRKGPEALYLVVIICLREQTNNVLYYLREQIICYNTAIFALQILLSIGDCFAISSYITVPGARLYALLKAVRPLIKVSY